MQRSRQVRPRTLRLPSSSFAGMSYNPNQFYLPPNPALPNPQLVPQPFPTGIPPQPPQQQPQFNLAALQQQQQQAQGAPRNGTPQQVYPGLPGGMVHPQFMGAPQTLTPQPQPPQGLPAQPQQNQVNVGAFEQLLRSGQLVRTGSLCSSELG